MMKETELFFAEIVREDRNVLDLLDADFTYVDRDLAAFYGLRNVEIPANAAVSQSSSA